MDVETMCAWNLILHNLVVSQWLNRILKIKINMYLLKKITNLPICRCIRNRYDKDMVIFKLTIFFHPCERNVLLLSKINTFCMKNYYLEGVSSKWYKGLQVVHVPNEAVVKFLWLRIQLTKDFQWWRLFIYPCCDCGPL